MHRKGSVYDSDEVSLAPKATPSVTVQQLSIEENEPAPPLSSPRAIWAWVILAFAVGPTHSMILDYIAAALQTVANAVGHTPGTNQPCSKKGSIACVISFGGTEVDYLSYILYIHAITRSIEGFIAIVISGIADFSNNRKTIMLGCIYLSGISALPFAALAGYDYDHLNAIATLSVFLSIFAGVTHVIKHSYLPLFMKSIGWSSVQDQDGDNAARESSIRGTRVSVYSGIAFRIGSLLALFIGMILTYTRQVELKEKYTNYLICTTIAGCVTIVFAVPGHILLPSVPGAKRPAGQNIFFLPFRVWYKTMTSVRRYPNAFKFCICWVLWSSSIMGFQSIIKVLFLETTGITQGSGVYTVFSFMTVIFSILGSVIWLYVSKLAKPRTWAFCILALQILCVSWGCLGISEDISIGYKQQAEFWVSEFLLQTSFAAMNVLCPVMLALLIPEGSAAAFFGLQNTIDLATGWISPLIQGAIQNSTHNMRIPMIQNLVLLLLAVAALLWLDFDQGIIDAKRPMNPSYAKDDAKDDL